MLDISSKYTDIEVVGTFKDKFNVLRGESGSGKTFLFSKIKSYLQDAKYTDYGLYTVKYSPGTLLVEEL